MNQEEFDAIKQFGKGKKTELKQGGRAVIYQRVSSREQELGFSPETQMKICRQWAEQHKYTVVKSFEGESESAKTDTNRKRFQLMLKFVKDKKNRIDAVIVYSTSRFSRTGTESFSIVDELKKRGITVFSASSSYDARTPDGEMVQGFELVQARHDNAVKSQAVIHNGATALRKGRWVTQVPMGYDMKTTKAAQTITVNKTGLLIRKAFQMKADENLSNEEVRVRMKEMGLDLRKQRWSAIFRNIFYAGYFSHPFLEGEVIKGPHEPLVSIASFCKINGITMQAHTRGYETKADKEYAPLLGSLICPVCGHNMTASLSTKMRKKYGREVGYYVCSHKDCKCNVAAKKANESFGEWLDSMSYPDQRIDVLAGQLEKAFPILNKQDVDCLAAIKTNLAHKESEIEKVEYNLALAPNAKVQEICYKQLEKLEAEKDEIQKSIDEKGKEILNLGEYLSYGLSLKNNLLKLWELSSLGHKRLIQKLVFPDGMVWRKENDDIEPISKNEFLFVCDVESMNCEQKENGQTVISNNLSAFAPLRGLEPRTP